MPKTAAPTRPASKPRSSATPKTLDQLRTRAGGLKDAIEAAVATDTQLRDDHATAARELSAAIKAEKFAAADAFKLRRDDLAMQREAGKGPLDALRVEQQEVAAAMSAAFFAASKVRNWYSAQAVTRVVVANPENEESDSAFYFEGGDTIQLNVSGQHFESDACYVGTWAAKHGFVMDVKTVNVDFT
jgi:hypothetical protein